MLHKLLMSQAALEVERQLLLCVRVLLLTGIVKHPE